MGDTKFLLLLVLPIGAALFVTKPAFAFDGFLARKTETRKRNGDRFPVSQEPLKVGVDVFLCFICDVHFGDLSE